MFREENYYKNRLLVIQRATISHSICKIWQFVKGSNNFRLKREYPPLTLAALQQMIDLNRLDTTKPIDLAAICRTGLYNCNSSLNHYGINLIEEVSKPFLKKKEGNFVVNILENRITVSTVRATRLISAVEPRLLLIN